MMINDIIAEHGVRMQNLKRYYPFFVLSEMTFAQYKDGKFADLDMGYITMASLRFLINENNFHEKDVTYEEFESFLSELLDRDFTVVCEAAEKKELISYIFDKLKNDGRAFEFGFYDPEEKKRKVARVRLITSRIENGRVLYTITPEAVEFFLDTKEIKEESRISVEQLLLEKMIRSDNFKGGIEVVKRINARVREISAQKEQVVKLLSADVFEGAKAYEDYMNTCAKWFSEEAKSFAKNKALVDKAVEKAGYEKRPGEEGVSATSGNRALMQIAALETELKKTIYNHSKLMEETMELSAVSDRMIKKAKLSKLRPVFDFQRYMEQVMEKDEPALLAHVLLPFAAPKIHRSFNLRDIDHLLNVSAGAKDPGEKVEGKKIDPDFKYEDEKLDEQIEINFARMFRELLDQLDKWGKLTLKEYNGILEIKFGKEIYRNRDYYSYLVHLAGKTRYDLRAMQEKQETMFEEIVVHRMSEEDMKRYGNEIVAITFGDEEITIAAGEDTEFTVTDMTFERRAD